MAKWLLLLIVAGLALWWFTRDPVEVAYQKCLKEVAAGVEKSTASGSNEFEKAMADAVKGLGKAMGTAGCDAMRAACKEDRDGALCKAAMAQF